MRGLAEIARARYHAHMASHPHADRRRLTTQSLERMREGLRKRAEALGRDHEQRFVEVLERGGRPPKLDTLMRIADALDAELLLEMRLRPAPSE